MVGEVRRLIPISLRPKCLVLSLLLVFLLVGQPRCFAAEAGSGPYWPGFRNFMAGVVPPKPGLYFRNDVLYYSATAPRVVLNGLPAKNISANATLDIIEPEYVFPWKLWGATHAFVVTQPFVWGKLKGRIDDTNLVPSGARFAPGDTIISPLFLGWSKGNLHYNTNLAIFAPVGDFDVNRVVNISRNFWAVDAEVAATNYDPKTGWELTGVLGFTTNFENRATRYTSGDVLHFDFAIGKTLRNGVKPGLLGYGWWQVTPDTGPGAIFGSFESRVYGIGPGVQWKAAENVELTFRYYHEFGARNHIVGDQAAISLRTAF